MAQQASYPEYCSSEWLVQVRRLLDVAGDGSLVVVLKGDEIALADLYMELDARGPVKVALAGGCIPETSDGATVLLRVDTALANSLNDHFPEIETRKLRLFAWVPIGQSQQFELVAPVLMQRASIVVVAPARTPEWIERNLQQARDHGGIVIVDDSERATHALSPVVRIDPRKPWPELEAILGQPGPRLYDPVADQWAGQRVCWAELLAPNDQVAFVQRFPKPITRDPHSWPNVFIPGESVIHMLPVDPLVGGEAALRRGLDPGGLWVPRSRRFPPRGFPTHGEPIGAAGIRLPWAVWSAGHADIARALLERAGDGRERLQLADERGMGAVMSEVGLSGWLNGHDAWLAIALCGLAIGSLIVRSGFGTEPLLLNVLRCLGVIVIWGIWTWPTFSLRLRASGIAMSFPRWSVSKTWRKHDREIDLFERAAARAIQDGDLQWATGLLRASYSLNSVPGDAPLHDPGDPDAPWSVLIRRLDLTACIRTLGDPRNALRTWEIFVLPGYRLLDWRERVAAVQESIATSRFHLGDIEGAQAAADPVSLTPQGARVIAAINLLRDDRPAAVAALVSAGLLSLANEIEAGASEVQLSDTRVGTRWLQWASGKGSEMPGPSGPSDSVEGKIE